MGKKGLKNIFYVTECASTKHGTLLPSTEITRPRMWVLVLGVLVLGFVVYFLRK